MADTEVRAALEPLPQVVRPVRPARRIWPLGWPATVVLLGVLSIAALAALLVHASVQRQRDDILQKRTGEIAASYETALGEVGSTLQVLSDVPLSPPGSVALFEEVAEPLLGDNVDVLVAVQDDGRELGVTASVGESVPNPLTGARAALAERAFNANDFVTAIYDDPSGTRLGYAAVSDDGTQVVLREVTIDPTTPADTVRGQVIDDLDVALYAAVTPDDGALLLSTADRVPLVGTTGERQMVVGDEGWLLVTSERQSLLSSFAKLAPWATLLAGAILALLLAALIESITRRRSYALALVDDRTATLQAALADQARLEAEARTLSTQASAANRYKSEFLSRMSHELRTPLSAVIGFAQLLDLDELTEVQRESVDHIQKGGRHLLDLINEVLDITRIETGDFTLSPEPVLAREILKESTDLMRPIADDMKIHLVSDTMALCDAHVFADRQRVKQILLNLLSNAVKYNRIGGTVSVSCSATADRLRLNVADTGPGIAPEHLDLLFEPFERLGAEHGDIEGTGIGLALCRRLAEAMEGAVDVDTTLGRGSTFWIELPLVEAPIERFDRIGPAMPSTAAATDAATGVHRILYIEDNLANLRLVERILQGRDDIELVAAMQGRLGLDLARQHTPVAILLDLHLPDIAGEEVLRALRDDPSTASIPVVILSADATPGHIQRVLAAGAHSYLTKPIDVRELLRTIDSLIHDDHERIPS